jgi:hypothetical protein
VKPCFREYGGKKGYVFIGCVLAPVSSKNAEERLAAMTGAANRLRFAGK